LKKTKELWEGGERPTVVRIRQAYYLTVNGRVLEDERRPCLWRSVRAPHG
jgi:predicted transcriptional regulator